MASLDCLRAYMYTLSSFAFTSIFARPKEKLLAWKAVPFALSLFLGQKFIFGLFYFMHINKISESCEDP